MLYFSGIFMDTFALRDILCLIPLLFIETYYFIYSFIGDSKERR
jgi:hypothetical protein